MTYFTLALIIFLSIFTLGLSVILLWSFIYNSKVKKIPYPPKNLNNKEMTFKLDEVIEIAEYVRVAGHSTPNARTKELVNEYLLSKDK